MWGVKVSEIPLCSFQSRVAWFCQEPGHTSMVRSLDESTVAKIKGKVVDGMRDAVGDNMLRKIHALVK